MTATQNQNDQSNATPGKNPGTPADNAEQGGHLMIEDDVGSGEKTPGEKETDELIRQIPQRTPEPPTADGKNVG